MQSPIKVALAGNPNSGKTTVFNKLTGLNQKIGNFPGVTVDKKSAKIKLPSGNTCNVIDLPGTYSIYPKSEEEKVVWDVLTEKGNPNLPDVVVVVADATNLKRNLLLFTQIYDLGIPCVLVLNMIDVVERRKKVVEAQALRKILNVPVIEMNARKGVGIQSLLETLDEGLEIPKTKFLDHPDIEISESNLAIARRKETIERYKQIDNILKGVVHDPEEVYAGYTKKLDKIFTHRIYGYLIFMGILLFVFQAIFKWAEWPMDLIDQGFSSLATWVATTLPSGILNDLMSQGIIPGLAGIVIFIPQIAILFGVISLLEETGYMARVVFLMDKLMRKVGLNGRSVVPLISSIACAVPAIMASRTIGNKKDRIITILVTPLMSCSARLPVYTILIALVIPTAGVGMFSLQGLTLLFMYFLGFAVAMIAALIIKLFVKSNETSYLVMEMPSYKVPRWSNMGLMVYEKTKTFVFEAGKIIMAISIVLWIAATYGPGDQMIEAEATAIAYSDAHNLSDSERANRVSAEKLEYSYAGYFGKAIEPAIRPLGYDWKIGIALVSSFAAREVFVGTMATIYSMGSTADENTVKERLSKEVNAETGGPRFTLAVGLSLMVFYAFAMQCMSTLAVVYRETKGWKWPLLQLGYMSALAYFSAMLIYNIFK